MWKSWLWPFRGSQAPELTTTILYQSRSNESETVPRKKPVLLLALFVCVLAIPASITLLSRLHF